MKPVIFVISVMLVFLVPAQTHANDAKESLNAFLNSGKEKHQLHVDFLTKHVLPNIKLSFGGLRSSDTVAQYNRSTNEMRLGKNLSVDGLGRRLKPYDELSWSEIGPIFHELSHAYLDWAKEEAGKNEKANGNARRINAFANSTRCRYENVVTKSGKKDTLTESQQYDLLDETWAMWLALMMMDPKMGLRPGDIQAGIRDMAKNGSVAAKYYSRWLRTTTYVSKESAMSAHEMRFLMRHMLKMDEDFIKETFKDFPRPFEKDKSCIKMSVMFVLDASGSMKKRTSSGATLLEEYKEQISEAVKGKDKNDEVALVVYRGCGNVNLDEDYTTDATLITNALKKISPSGSTPLAEAINFGREHMKTHSRGRQGKFVVLTDGIETCRGDPVGAAKRFTKGPSSREE